MNNGRWKSGFISKIVFTYKKYYFYKGRSKLSENYRCFKLTTVPVKFMLQIPTNLQQNGISEGIVTDVQIMFL